MIWPYYYWFTATCMIENLCPFGENFKMYKFSNLLKLHCTLFRYLLIMSISLNPLINIKFILTQIYENIFQYWTTCISFDWDSYNTHIWDQTLPDRKPFLYLDLCCTCTIISTQPCNRLSCERLLPTVYIMFTFTMKNHMNGRFKRRWILAIDD